MKFKYLKSLGALIFSLFLLLTYVNAMAQHPTAANESQVKILFGANFIPSSAVNQLEMWQAETFDPKTIDSELALAENIGMNAMRVYLHHAAWKQDSGGFKNRLNEYLDISRKHGIRAILVFFDDCWRDSYKTGKQPDQVPSVHNSQWLKDPGGLIDKEPKLMDTLESYVKDVMKTFGKDKRILMWDLYNEPGHFGRGEKSWPLLKNTVKWAREAKASQPITIGIWNSEPKFLAFNKFQLQNSDVISFHNYQDTISLKQALDTLTKMGKPVICTEYMKRPTGSTFQNCLPIFKRCGVAAINWGLVAGKTQTNYPQSNKGGEAEPKLWYHDIFRKDGSPFDSAEIEAIQKFTRKKNQLGFSRTPSTFQMPAKLFVVSDLEGELDGFRRLLLNNGIINGKNQWTFKKAHLVICGDLMDRGPQVFELLEFLTNLETEAKNGGGQVHTILGNHDIMNLSGDYRYVNKKYLDQSRKPTTQYLSLISKGSKYGDWLRSKNIIEKIGNMLFLHAGISPEILNLGYSIDELNEACKPFYAVKQKELPPDRKVLFGANSPFWYRGYFMNPRASTALVDSTLKQYDVNCIIVGHTILKRNMASYYGGKVIGIDVDRHNGDNYGLFYQKGKWMIADENGHKTPLKYKPENDTISDKDIE